MTYLQTLSNAADKAAVADANFAKLDTQILRGTAALDFSSIAAGASADLTLSVPGAVVNDPVELGRPAAPTAGILYAAFVSAADTVTIRATNITAAPIDPASQTFKVFVMRY